MVGVEILMFDIDAQRRVGVNPQGVLQFPFLVEIGLGLPCVDELIESVIEFQVLDESLTIEIPMLGFIVDILLGNFLNQGDVNASVKRAPNADLGLNAKRALQARPARDMGARVALQLPLSVQKRHAELAGRMSALLQERDELGGCACAIDRSPAIAFQALALRV